MVTAQFLSLKFSHPDVDTEAGTPERCGLRLTPQGGLATVTEGAAVRQALILLLTTIPGERVNRPDYGCPLHRLLFAAADDTTAGLAIHYVRQAITRWEPRVEIVELDARGAGFGGLSDSAADVWSSESGSVPSRVDLQIYLVYRVKLTRDVGTLNLALPLAEGGATA